MQIIIVKGWETWYNPANELPWKGRHMPFYGKKEGIL